MDFILFAKDSSRSHSKPFDLLEWETLRSVVHYTHSMLASDDGRFNPKFWFGFSNRQNTFCKSNYTRSSICWWISLDWAGKKINHKNNKTKNTKNARAWYGWLNELRCKKKYHLFRFDNPTEFDWEVFTYRLGLLGGNCLVSRPPNFLFTFLIEFSSKQEENEKENKQ